MARLARLSRNDENHAESTQRQRSGNTTPLSPSPPVSFSSDKENHTANLPSRTPRSKPASMPPPSQTHAESADIGSERASKRRRLVDHDAPHANNSQATHARMLEKLNHKDFYDPDQSIEERREIRKDYRDLSKDLTDSKSEYLASDSHGLRRTVEKANELYDKVRQTSDATLDSRLLVSAADLSAKRTKQLQLGDASQGIDVDDFVSRCITFMRRGDASRGTQSRQHRRDDEEDTEDNDCFNWSYLGAAACIPQNLRPPTPGFLLGPLSMQRRARRQTQRTQRLQKRDPNDAVRPEELKVKDVEKNESSSLTTLCTHIRSLLHKTQTEGSANVEAEAADDMSEDEIAGIFDKRNLCTDGGVPLFRFVINPRSFGQTVENLFYISFLIRDGTCGIGQAEGQPTLHVTTPSSREEAREQNNEKRQAIFHLDYETWEDLISAFDIKESIIPHREPDDEVRDGHSGWK